MGSRFVLSLAAIGAGLVLSVGVLSGCAASPEGSAEAADERIEYRGFSIPRPKPQWYLRKEEQAPSQAVIRRKKKDSDTHGLLAAVDLRFIGASPKSHEDLARVARADEIENEARFTRLHYEQRLSTRQGQWCIEYESRVLDRFPTEAPPGVALQVRARGTRCLHPAWPGTLIDIVWVEQGRPEELDDSLVRDAEEYLAGVRIETAPGVPAGEPSRDGEPEPPDESRAPWRAGGQPIA